ncbi:MAG: hypothetical protein PHU25_17975 [Deltaproteobacteria bacterium]|nr:hypothetical protein [Deltaproteobacteria bacterium]
MRIPQPDEIRVYLALFPDPADLAADLCAAAAQRFGDRAQVSLELYRSREFDDEYLTIYVRQERYESGAGPRNRRWGSAKRSAVSRTLLAAYCHAARHVRGFAPDRRASDHGRLIAFCRQHRLSDVADKLGRLEQWRAQCDYDDDVQTWTKSPSSR